MLNKTLIVPSAILAALTIVGCGKKQQQEEIIVEKIVEKPQTEVKSAARASVTNTIEWIDGNNYEYTIAYESLDTVPAVENYGELYRDNAVTVTINRGDGSEMCSKKIMKSSFSGLLSDEMRTHGLLVSVVYNKCDSNALYFVATVGSPDENNEDYVLLQYIIDRYGNTQVAKYSGPVI